MIMLSKQRTFGLSKLGITRSYKVQHINKDHNRNMSINSLPVICVKEVAGQAANRPKVPRSGHACATMPADHKFSAIIFGGYTESVGTGGPPHREATNECWGFSADTQQWLPVEYAAGKHPQPRFACQAVVVGEKLVVLGGWDPQKPGTGGVILSDVWTLDLKTWEWKLMEVAGEKLEPISRFQAVAVGSNIWIHTHRSLADILVLDTSSEPYQLSKRSYRSGSPSPPSRGLHSLTLVGNSLYLFGGAPKAGPMFGDLWKLDLDSLEWMELHPSGEQPAARCSHTAAKLGHYVVFCGGSFYEEGGTLQALGDVFLYDAQANAWIYPQVQGTLPSPRNAATACVLPNEQVLLHGGWKAFVETYNDTHLLGFAS